MAPGATSSVVARRFKAQLTVDPQVLAHALMGKGSDRRLSETAVIEETHHLLVVRFCLVRFLPLQFAATVGLWLPQTKTFETIGR